MSLDDGKVVALLSVSIKLQWITNSDGTPVNVVSPTQPLRVIENSLSSGQFIERKAVQWAILLSLARVPDGSKPQLVIVRLQLW